MASVRVYNHQSLRAIDGVTLERLAESALPECLARPGTGRAILSDLDEIEVTLLDDAAMSRVHGRFLDDDSPTDVITFDHGEILVSVDAAARECAEHGHGILWELLVYAVHGMLHLNGHRDDLVPAREFMHRVQDDIVSALKAAEPGSVAPQ